MTIFIRTFIVLLSIPVIGIGALYLTGNSFILKATERTYLKGHRTANINDHEAFKVNTIRAGTPESLPVSARYNQTPLPEELRQRLEQYRTAAFLVLKDGKIVTEHYMSGYNDRSRTNSFSMAKTVTTMLLGIAIEEGLIRGLDQKLTDFIPKFNQDPLGKTATVGQLSLMNSGYEWTEHYYSPFSPTVELYHGPDIEDFLVNEGEFTSEPGSYWYYSSASTQLLGIVLKRALAAAGKNITLSEYLSEKIWQPLQMNDDALWHTDDSGMELVFCCINTNARNFAKLGLLMMNQGAWHGQQIVPAAFVSKMTKSVGKPYYGYSTWLSHDTEPAYYWFSGHLGQYIINIPEFNTVIVRLGETRDDNTSFRTEELPILVQQGLRLAGVDLSQTALVGK